MAVNWVLVAGALFVVITAGVIGIVVGVSSGNKRRSSNSSSSTLVVTQAPAVITTVPPSDSPSKLSLFSPGPFSATATTNPSPSASPSKLLPFPQVSYSATFSQNPSISLSTSSEIPSDHPSAIPTNPNPSASPSALPTNPNPSASPSKLQLPFPPHVSYSAIASQSPSTSLLSTSSEIPSDHPSAIPSDDSSSSSAPSSIDHYCDWSAGSVSLADGVQYEIVEQLNHDSNAFTQGLTYYDGLLFESTGRYGRSTIRTLDPDTGEVLSSHPLDSQYFAEGLAYVPFSSNQLIQLTWKARTGFIYDRDTLIAQASNTPANPELVFNFDTTLGEGWGITYNDETHELIVSDGSSFLHFWDPSTLEEIRTVQVFRQESGSIPATRMNELEFWRGRVLANIWYQDIILVIHPETGIVEKEYDFSQLWPENLRQSSGADVLNGISVSADPDILFVTGKLWNRMYKLRLLHVCPPSTSEPTTNMPTTEFPTTSSAVPTSTITITTGGNK